MQPINNANFVEYLFEALPEMRGAYQYMLDYYGEIFNYALIGGGLVKLTMNSYGVYTSSGEHDLTSKDFLNRLADFLENCATLGDEDIYDLILVGFMEHLDSNHPHFPGVVALLKPASRELLRRSKGL
jgi:hypothetical protein